MDILEPACHCDLNTVPRAWRPKQVQRFAEWVTGNRDVEEDWEGYLKELNGLGVDTYIATYKQALDRAEAANS